MTVQLRESRETEQRQSFFFKMLLVWEKKPYKLQRGFGTGNSEFR
jgi:hypothetical protein